MLFKFYIYLIILFTFILCWICISFYTAFLLTITFLCAFEVHDRFVPVDGVRAAHHGKDWSAIFNSDVKSRRKIGKTKMFKNWNPFRKKSEKDGNAVTIQSFKQEPKPSNKENTLNLSQFSSHFSKTEFKPSPRPSPRPITLARRGSLKITRLKPVSELISQNESVLNKSSFNNSSFKSDRSVNDVSIFNASGPLLSSPFIPQVKQALGYDDTFSPFGSPNTSRSRVKRSNTFHYTPSHPTTPTQVSLPVVRLGRKDRHSFREGNTVLNSPNTVKIAPPDVQRFPTCRLTSIRERYSSTSSQPPDTQAVVSALKERRKRSFVHHEESIMEDIDFSQQSKRRRQESTQSTASSASLPAMPDHLPDLSESGYTLMPIESVGLKRPAAPSRESFDEHEVSLAKRPKRESRNDPIKSSLRSSKSTLDKEILQNRKSVVQRPSMNYSKQTDVTNTEINNGNVSPASSDISMISLRNQPTIILSEGKAVVNERLRMSNDELFNSSNDTIISQDTSVTTTLSTTPSKRLLFDGIKTSTKKRQLSLYPSLNTSFKKVPVANVVASAEDYEKDREEEQKRVTDMLQEITEEHENKNKKDVKPVVPETSKTQLTISSNSTKPISTSTLTTLLSTEPLTKVSESTSTSRPAPTSSISSLMSTTVSGVSSLTSSTALGQCVPSCLADSDLIRSLATTSTTISSSSAAVTTSNYTFKPVFGAPSTTTSVSTSLPSSFKMSSALGLGTANSSTITVTSGFAVPKVTQKLDVSGVSSISSSLLGSALGSALNIPVSQTTSSLAGSNPVMSTGLQANTGGFSFGQTPTNNQTTSILGFGQALQAASNPIAGSTRILGFGQTAHTASNPVTGNISTMAFGQTVQAASNPVSTAATPVSGFNFGLAGQTTTQTTSTQGNQIGFQSPLNTVEAQPQSTTQSSFSFSKNTPASTGGFGFGGGTTLSALQNISALSGIPNPTQNYAIPTTNPPPYSVHSTGQAVGVSVGLPKPTFNFSTSPSVTTTKSGESVFDTSSFTPIASSQTSKGSVFGTNQPAVVSNSSSFAFGTPANAAAAPAFGQTTTSSVVGFNFGQTNPVTKTTQQNTPSFSFNGGTEGNSGNTDSIFGVSAPAKPFAFGTSQSVPTSGFGTSNISTTFGSSQPNITQQTLSFGNKPVAQTTPFGTASGTTSNCGSATPAFGNKPSNSAPAFGQTSTASLPTPFGNNSQQPTPSSSFGQSGNVFGASNQNASSFGQGSTSNSSFQFSQNSSTPSAGSFQFGQTTPIKAGNPTPSFGQSSTNQNSGFNFAAPGANPSFSFGMPSTPGMAPTGSFGTPTTPNMFSSGAVPKPRAASSRSARRGRPRR